MRTVDLIPNSTVLVGRNLFQLIAKQVANQLPNTSKICLVSDQNVAKLYLEKLVQAFQDNSNFRHVQNPDQANLSDKIIITYVVIPGEDSKSRKTKADVEDFMLQFKCNRDTCMIALGGGVVGDLVGFVAATYMRGVPVIQIPTSSTAMIDSSVGGKTAINVPAGKNLIGAFHQPKRVYADLDLLATLGKRELVEGIAEAIKMGCIRHSSLFDVLESQPSRIMSLDDELIEQVIYESILNKAQVVLADEREAGLRSTLNWGHTIGHAIEALMSPAMMHGECVSVGCVVEAELSRRMGNDTLTREKIDRIAACFQAYGLPVHAPKLCIETLEKKMALDKKNQGNTIRCTIVTDIGTSMTNPQPVEKSLVAMVLSESMEKGAALPPWRPHVGSVAELPAGGQMSN